MKSINSVVLFLLTFVFFSCSTGNNNVPDPLVAHIDSTVNPAADFFMYANGKWFKQHPIPASESSNGIFQMIQDTINAQILLVCTSASSNPQNEKGSNKQKIGDFYF